MSTRLRKIVYHVEVETLDDEGNPVDEGLLVNRDSGQPLTFTLYAHQLGELSERVAEAIKALDAD